MKSLLLSVQILFMMFGFIANVNAIPINLIGGAADPFNIGPVPVPPNPEQALRSDQIASMTDGSDSTGFSFSSSMGEYSSDPETVIGFGIRFDFDISDFSSIDSLTFSWTGLMNWSGCTFRNMRIGAEPSIVATRISFGSDCDSPYGMAQSADVVFESMASSFQTDLSYVVDGGIASIWVSTDLGISCRNCLDYIEISTFEVSADVVGTRIDVPEPSSLLLMSLGLLGFAGCYRKGIS